MSLSFGRRLGPYEIGAPIGSGGMGEVYRAHDTKLDRDVAIKVLPEEFAADKERLARFEREAKLLASLNHPNIAAIYGLEDSDGVRALVLELVEGPTLAERIAEGPIPVDEAIAIARQIAEAFEAGHEAGVVHRDLKPANVKVREDGTVKVLDYGLAKALEGGAARSGDSELSQSPTLTRHGTQVGTILGTSAYMSPEQAKGKRVDERADVWAFGAVVYEMLTGKRAFAGENVSDTLAAVLRSEPNFDALPAEVPASLRRVLQLCLTKDVKQRFHAIGDVRLVIDGAFEALGGVQPSGQASGRSVVFWLVAGVALAVTVAALVSRTPAETTPVQKFTLTTVMADPIGAHHVSPDGRHIVGIGRDAAGENVLWLRSLDTDEDVALPGTEGVRRLSVFWAPDSSRVAFQANDALQAVDLTGAPPKRIAEYTGLLRGGTWNTDDVILFSGSEGGRLTIRKVPASGGTVTEVTALDASRQEESHRFPFFLPDGERFLFTSRGAEGYQGIHVGNLTSGETTELLQAFSYVAYAEPGYLLYVRDETLLAQRIDLSTLELEGAPQAVVSGVSSSRVTGGRGFSVSRNGMLVYKPTGFTGARLTWLDRIGRVVPSTLADDEREAMGFALSNDGSLAAVARWNFQLRRGSELWRLDLSRGVSTRLTGAGGGDDRARSRSADTPVWAPDGRRLVYRVQGRNSLAVLDVESREGDDLSFDVGAPSIPTDWTPDGRFIAYVSDQTGRSEVWIASFPDGARPQRLSLAGGTGPRFSANGRELFYVSPLDEVIAVPIELGISIELGEPVVLWGASFRDLDGQPEWEVIDNGERFVIANRGEQIVPEGEQQANHVERHRQLAADDRGVSFSRDEQAGSGHEGIFGLELGKSTEVSIRRPQTVDAVMHTKGGYPGIVYLRSCNARRFHYLGKTFPVSIRLRQQHQAGRFELCGYLVERCRRRGWLREDPGVGNDGEKLVNAWPRDSPSSTFFGKGEHLGFGDSVPRRVASMSVNENIGVDGDHDPRPS